MISVKGESYVLEIFIKFNFQTSGYNIWPRFNDMFYCNGLFLRFIIYVYG
jgi:hypothetical protein